MQAGRDRSSGMRGSRAESGGARRRFLVQSS